jgi:predicted transcriptional regulator
MEKRQFHELERILKGVGSHRRIQILDLLEKEKGLYVSQIAGRVSIDFRTTSAHLSRLVRSGLIYKWHQGAAVCHSLSPLGKHVLKFCRTLE